MVSAIKHLELMWVQCWPVDRRVQKMVPGACFKNPLWHVPTTFFKGLVYSHSQHSDGCKVDLPNKEGSSWLYFCTSINVGHRFLEFFCRYIIYGSILFTLIRPWVLQVQVIQVKFRAQSLAGHHHNVTWAGMSVTVTFFSTKTVMAWPLESFNVPSWCTSLSATLPAISSPPRSSFTGKPETPFESLFKKTPTEKLADVKDGILTFRPITRFICIGYDESLLSIRLFSSVLDTMTRRSRCFCFFFKKKTAPSRWVQLIPITTSVKVTVRTSQCRIQVEVPSSWPSSLCQCHTAMSNIFAVSSIKNPFQSLYKKSPTDKPADVKDGILAFRTITTILAKIQQKLSTSDNTLCPNSDAECEELSILNTFATVTVMNDKKVAVVADRRLEGGDLGILACQQLNDKATTHKFIPVSYQQEPTLGYWNE